MVVLPVAVRFTRAGWTSGEQAQVRNRVKRCRDRASDSPPHRRKPAEMQRVSKKPEDLADAILFLAGPHARRITGQTLSVNGGISAA